MEFIIDENCEICQKGLDRMAEIKSLKNCWSGQDGKGKPIKGVILTPDFNRHGVLTHWHIAPQK